LAARGNSALCTDVQEEQKEVFSLVSEYMTAEEREQLGREFTIAKSQLQSEISVVI
jgi:Trp operon repressor